MFLVGAKGPLVQQLSVLSFEKNLKNYVQICKKGLKAYYFLANSMKLVNEICNVQLLVASKIAFCKY